jgi:dolichyl-phosphate-mannose-protein mannosyltransferase
MRHRMAPPVPGNMFLGWAGPLVVTAIGAFLRLYRLAVPHAIVFDESTYVPDAYSILRHGTELQAVRNANALLLAGNTHILLQAAQASAHPPFGKIMIASGIWLFGLAPFGWRLAVAVAGSLAILMTARITRRMTRSTLLGCIAGLLLALDGLEFVLSRTALLDVFVMFWVLAAFGLLVIDRDRTRARIADAAPPTAKDPGGRNAPGEPKLGIRWLRVIAGACLGLACGVKWNGVFYLPAFAALVIAWDLRACRVARFANPLHAMLRSDATWLPIWFAAIPAAAYAACWSGWFASSDGYDRNGAALNNGHPTSAVVAWYQYNKLMLQVGIELRGNLPGSSNPLGWLVLARPIALYSSCLPATACGAAKSTEQEVLAIGTPLIWWGGTAALLTCLIWWLARRTWQASAVLMGVAAGWLPWIWFYFLDHRIDYYYYYAVIFDPFLVIAITLCLGLIMGQSRAPAARRAIGAGLAGVYLIAVLANFVYLYPVIAAQVTPYSSWLSRMWFHSWI